MWSCEGMTSTVATGIVGNVEEARVWDGVYNPITPGEGTSGSRLEGPGCLIQVCWAHCGQRENLNCDPGKKAEVKTRGLCRSLSGKTGQGDRWQEDEEWGRKQHPRQIGGVVNHSAQRLWPLWVCESSSSTCACSAVRGRADSLQTGSGTRQGRSQSAIVLEGAVVPTGQKHTIPSPHHWEWSVGTRKKGH